MIILWFSLFVSIVSSADFNYRQLAWYKLLTKESPVLTTSAGAPVEYTDYTTSLNRNLIRNEFLMDSLSHLTHERIPERFSHAKGSGAFGYFEVTHDVTQYTKAKFLSEIGKITPVAVRFSSIIASKGGSDNIRDARGFAVKFYTEEGNYDYVGFSTPVFVVKDPLYQTAFVHASHKNPATNMNDPNMTWDFLTLRPEGFFVYLYVLSDIGIPDGYRGMNGYSIHTLQLENKKGKLYFARINFQPINTPKYLNSTQAAALGGKDPDYAHRDLYNAIGEGNYPEWNMTMQVLSLQDVKNASFDVFDVTMVLPEDQYPNIPVGRLVLNRNPKNYHDEVEQLALCAANLVPGISGGPDKLFEARKFAYRDAQKYRLGVNFNKIPVNRPLTNVVNYNREGRAPSEGLESDAPFYFPNSFNGPAPVPTKSKELLKIKQVDEATNFGQASDFYESLSEEEKDRLIENAVESLGKTESFLQERSIAILSQINKDLANRIAEGIGLVV